jgi:CO/xanthine dehydrogenase Mo-binding subunit
LPWSTAEMPGDSQLWWRSVGHTTAFVMGTLVDELATRAGVDPVAYRQNLLKPDAKKLRRVIDLVDEKSATWRNHLAEGQAAGVACPSTELTGNGVGPDYNCAPEWFSLPAQKLVLVGIFHPESPG